MVNGGSFPAYLDAIKANFINNPQNLSYTPRAYSPDYKVPERIYQYNASIQRELPSHVVATAAFVGSQGRNLFLRSIANRILSVRTNTNPASSGIVIREFDSDQGGNT